MKSFGFIYFILFYPLFLNSYPWPIRPFNTAHNPSAMLGDARGSLAKPVFHRGIVIPADSGTNGLYLHLVGANKR